MLTGWTRGLVWGVCCGVSVLVCLAAKVAEAGPKFETVAAKLIQPRQGIGHVLAKLERGEEVKIAYLGGSITAAPGWRVQSLKWFQSRFPQATVSEIHAAIGGTGSDLGVFRVQQDALQERPDLLFVEFAVNDGGASPERIWSAMEGIVRQTWAALPETDICFVYTFRVGYEADLRQGNCPRAASAMEQLAAHYGIPSVNFALDIVQQEAAGKLVFQAPTPPEGNVVHFSTDGVHPLIPAHQLYADLLAKAVEEMLDLPPVDHAKKLAQPFGNPHWQAARMEAVRPEMLSGDWQALPEDAALSRSFSKRLGQIWETTTPGSKLRFQFRGSTAKLYDLVGPDGGQVIITVDGQRREKLIPRFDSYCTYHRLSTLTLLDGADPEQIHTVEIEVHPEQPDRTPVAFRLKNPDQELQSDKYQGTKLRIGKVMLIGELVE